jgi:hypothetical protein
MAEQDYKLIPTCPRDGVTVLPLHLIVRTALKLEGLIEVAASRFHLFTFAPSLLGMSALPPKADMCSATRDVRFGPIADMACGGQLLNLNGDVVRDRYPLA